mgnify:CR=1 FL=1
MRKRAAKKRPLLPDPKFNDQLVTRFVNNLMWDGKKSTAFKVFYDALEIVETKKQDAEKTALEIWKDALTNVMPHVEVRSRRVGGATFQIPMQIRPDRKISYAIKWMILYARRRNEKSMAGKLASEILAAAKEALLNGKVAVSPTSGFHHAGYEQAWGYCTFNGLLITAQKLLNENLVKSIGLLDYDYHQGDGSEDIIHRFNLYDKIIHITGKSGYSREKDLFFEEMPFMLESLKDVDIISPF